MTKHTHEPWIIWNDGDGILMDSCASPKRGGIALMCCNELVSGAVASANARRIVACVNALAGLTTEQIEDGVFTKMRDDRDFLAKQNADLLDAQNDHHRLVRELDVLLNGVDAAPQASLCDLVAQLKSKGGAA